MQLLAAMICETFITREIISLWPTKIHHNKQFKTIVILLVKMFQTAHNSNFAVPSSRNAVHVV